MESSKIHFEPQEIHATVYFPALWPARRSGRYLLSSSASFQKKRKMRHLAFEHDSLQKVDLWLNHIAQQLANQLDDWGEPLWPQGDQRRAKLHQGGAVLNRIDMSAKVLGGFVLRASISLLDQAHPGSLLETASLFMSLSVLDLDEKMVWLERIRQARLPPPPPPKLSTAFIPGPPPRAPLPRFQFQDRWVVRLGADSLFLTRPAGIAAGLMVSVLKTARESYAEADLQLHLMCLEHGTLRYFIVPKRQMINLIIPSPPSSRL